jgi:hypothetical protein
LEENIHNILPPFHVTVNIDQPPLSGASAVLPINGVISHVVEIDGVGVEAIGTWTLFADGPPFNVLGNVNNYIYEGVPQGGETVSWTDNATVGIEWNGVPSGDTNLAYETVTCSNTTTYTRPHPPEITSLNCSTVGPTINYNLEDEPQRSHNVPVTHGTYFTTTCEAPGYSFVANDNLAISFTMRNYADGIEYDYWDYHDWRTQIVWEIVNGAIVITDPQTFFNAIDLSTGLMCPGVVTSWDYTLTVEATEHQVSTVSTHSGSFITGEYGDYIDGQGYCA